MRTIRVRALYTRYPHLGAHSGFQQFCRHLSPERVRASLQPVSDGDQDWPLPSNPISRWLRRVGERDMSWYRLSDLHAEMRSAAAALLQFTDVVHYLDGEHTAQYLPRWNRRWPAARVRTVATFHQPPALLGQLVSRRTVSSIDLVTLVSPTQEPFFREYLPARRVRTILHGVDADFFRPRAPESGQSAGRRFRCVTAGHWMRDWQAVRAVIELLGRGQDIEFHLITSRDTGISERHNVTVHRHVDDESLRRLYQEADLLFLPLVDSTANNSLLEGLACGLPVVSTRLPSVMAYVGEDAAELIENNDPDALTLAILGLRDDRIRRARMGAAARARAEALAWPSVAPQIERAYADVMER